MVSIQSHALTDVPYEGSNGSRVSSTKEENESTPTPSATELDPP